MSDDKLPGVILTEHDIDEYRLIPDVKWHKVSEPFKDSSSPALTRAAGVCVRHQIAFDEKGCPECAKALSSSIWASRVN